jgi:biotin operon repressor
MADIPLNEADEGIVDALSEGRNVPANLADELGYSRQYVQNRIKRLREHGIVKNVGRGVYELVEDPREESSNGT